MERKPNGIKIVDDEEEEEEETVAEKRLRLAKQYIAQVEEEGMSLPPHPHTFLERFLV